MFSYRCLGPLAFATIVHVQQVTICSVFRIALSWIAIEHRLIGVLGGTMSPCIAHKTLSARLAWPFSAFAAAVVVGCHNC